MLPSSLEIVMTSRDAPEVWLRGPLPDYSPELMPVAHALLQSREDIDRVTADLPDTLLWRKPGAAAPPGFHLKHIAGSLDRLISYAQGVPLSPARRAALESEKTPGSPATTSEATRLALRSIDTALAVLRAWDPGTLDLERRVGTMGYHSTSRGLLFHAAEHTTRHVGQLVTTLLVLQGVGSRE
jgi:hypothetical protein